MTLRTRQVIVAAGLAVLAIWALATWMQSTAQEPLPTNGPRSHGLHRVRASHLRPE